MEQSVIKHLTERQCSNQWKGFLQSLATVLGGLGSPAELQNLFQQAGKEFANRHPLPACVTLAQMAAAMSAVWQENRWGWVELHERDTYLEIQHYCSPVVAAVGAEHASWMVGFLEGAYQQWFDTLEPDTGLKVSAVAPFDALGSLQLQLGQ